MQSSQFSHVYELAKLVGHCLKDQRAHLVTVESCTGGWLGKVITDIPGSSEWYYGGWVVYSNEAKQVLVGVKQETLSRYGAVSEQTAKELVKGALQKTSADYAISITGVAGPSGGSEEKPVGTVFAGFGKREKPILIHRLQYPNSYSREMIRFLTINHVLLSFLEFLKN